MTDKTRTFIALELNPQIQQNIKVFSNPFQKSEYPGIRWVKTESIHITLKFLGDSTAAQIKDVSIFLNDLALKFPPITVDVNGVGAFPSWAHPRVVWVGILAPDLLSKLYYDLDLPVSKLGYPKGSSRFAPHLTFARISDRADIKQVTTFSRALQDYQNTPFGSLTLNRVVLFKSTLQPGGSIYTPLSTHPFQGEG